MPETMSANTPKGGLPSYAPSLIDLREKTMFEATDHKLGKPKSKGSRWMLWVVPISLLVILGLATSHTAPKSFSGWIPCHRQVDEGRQATSAQPSLDVWQLKQQMEAVRREDAPLITAPTTFLKLVRRDDNSTTVGPTSKPPTSTGPKSSTPKPPTTSTPSPSPTVTPPPRSSDSTTKPGTTTTTSTAGDGDDDDDDDDDNATPAPTSKAVIHTRTTTRSNGQIVVVTLTSFVPPDVVPTAVVTAPSLHNAGSRLAEVCMGFVVLGTMVVGVLLL